jgi:hypothetical protein
MQLLCISSIFIPLVPSRKFDVDEKRKLPWKQQSNIQILLEVDIRISLPPTPQKNDM